MAAFVALASVLVGIVAPASALGVATYSWSEGNGTKFTGTKTSALSATAKSPYTITLKQSATKSKIASPADSIQPLSGSTYLVADESGKRVVEANSTAVTRTIVDSNDTTLVAPVWARRYGSDTVVVDRDGGRVLVVTGSTIWSYGDGGELNRPTAATLYGSGSSATVLIADTGNGRLLEVKRSDKSVKWKYTGASRPTSVQRLDADEVLYSDEGTNQIVVLKGTKVNWTFGSSGSGITQLSRPQSVQRVKGVYFVNDAGNRRVLRVTTTKAAVAVATSSDESQISFTNADGSTVVGTSISSTSTGVKGYGYTTSEQRYQTKTLDLGTPGVAKWITRITVLNTKYANTTVRATYSINGGSWKTLKNLNQEWPKGLKATTLRVRVYLDTADRSVSPILTQVAATYTVLNPMTPENNAATANLNAPNLSGLNTGLTSPFGVPTSGTVETTAATVPGFDPGAPTGPTGPTTVSGSTFEKVSTDASAKVRSMLVEPAGLAAATLLLGTCFAIGAFGGQIGAASKTLVDAAAGMVARTPKA